MDEDEELAGQLLGFYRSGDFKTLTTYRLSGGFVIERINGKETGIGFSLCAWGCEWAEILTEGASDD